MGLQPGARLGAYEIVAPLGAGGMGEVYRGRDTKLKRDVAIKILPDAFASDVERLARFQREAELLASLNHPNIAQIHGLEDRALILELVEGPTLADRIAQEPIPIDEVLLIARQTAEALEAAHDRGIIHRDLKPANIKLTADGKVKVLDFGLAKLSDPANTYTPRPDVSQSPTVTSPAMMTMGGAILGTAAYMSPEQARGKPVDKRTDIWAFGCVLYEMLSGKRAFEGDDVFDTLGAIARGEPSWETLPSITPPNIRKLLRRCLQKDRTHRLADIADAKLEIEDALASPTEQSTLVVRPARTMRKERLAWSAALLLAVVGTALAGAFLRTSPTLPEMRFEITTTTTDLPNSFALSPDGQRLVFVAASADGPPRLWVRPFNSTSPQPLAGTEGATNPFWSPDSRSVGFIAGNKLKTIAISGGLPQTLTDASNGTNGGATWSSDDIILFTRNTLGPLSRIQASGEGVPVEVTHPGPQQHHSFPSFLPGGKQFLFYSSGTPETRGIYLGSLDSSNSKRLTPDGPAAAYAPPGWLLFVRESALVARHVDLTRGELSGEEVTLANPVVWFSVSTTGQVAYRSGGTSRRQLMWFNRFGEKLDSIGAPDESLSAPRLSPVDSQRVAYWSQSPGSNDIWLLDATHPVRFTFDSGSERFPIWSPDGQHIVFDSNRKGPRDLYQSSSPGSEEPLFESSQDKAANDWSSDGQFVLYQSTDLETGYDLWILPVRDRKPIRFLRTNAQERRGMFSPDGRWVAYLSNESGRYEVWVKAFTRPNPAMRPTETVDSPGERRQVSMGGGIQPSWSRDGKELYYIAPDAKLMAVPINADGTAGAAVALFQTRIVGATSVDAALQYDVARDGRFLVNTRIDETSPITVILNWAGLTK